MCSLYLVWSDVMFMSSDISKRTKVALRQHSEVYMKELLLDTEVFKKVFRKHFAELTKLMSLSTNRLIVAAELYSEELITDTCYDEAVDDGPRTDMAKGVSLAKAVKATIKCQPQLITKLISILQNIEAFNSLAVKMSHDCGMTTKGDIIITKNSAF